ncbi:hypothetical protein SAMN05444004_11725 [Jannaschia faecimaris]|uniref:Uncharacterized protein n=1 Tax=Jannaschia faecimaris TaxID=1244108 RepID=A0A1H3TIV2_9RHOB|nr:hypothetical protein [Jannaschia faecimaris]SDZ49585.1 hypothetical protein SAMN05444004_11725 [Jannaschia faecimaris]
MHIWSVSETGVIPETLLPGRNRSTAADIATHTPANPPSTGFRQPDKIGQSLDGPVFHRNQGLYSPTEFGAEIVLAAGRMEQETARITRRDWT